MGEFKKLNIYIYLVYVCISHTYMRYIYKYQCLKKMLNSNCCIKKNNWLMFYQAMKLQCLHLSSSVQFSRSVESDSLWPHGLQHTSPPCPSPTSGVYPNSCPLSQWCHLTISSSVIPFSCLQSFLTSAIHIHILILFKILFLCKSLQSIE